MPGVVFVGLGLDSEKGISVEGLEEARRADAVFAEFYTSVMPNLNMQRLEALIGKEIRVLTRPQLEDENADEILRTSWEKKVVFLVPGDPMIATTHVSICLALAKKKIPFRIVHGASIISAICGATGLQSFKFGKSITLPERDPVPISVLDTIRENKSRGLHSLLLLDTSSAGGMKMTVQDSLGRLVRADSSVEEWLAVGAARVGSPDEMVRTAPATTLMRLDFGDPPHCIVFPGKLHFMEEETLRAFTMARAEDLGDNR